MRNRNVEIRSSRWAMRFRAAWVDAVVGCAVTPRMWTRRLAISGLTFLWVGFHDRPGSGGQRPARVSSAMAIKASGLR
jgi:hypothetical protein